MPTRQRTSELLLAVAEPTRLRIVNCLAAAPLFVSDLQTVLRLPQPTVSRHLRVLRDAGVVRDTPIAQFVLYRLQRDGDVRGRLLGAIVDALLLDGGFRREREEALQRSRSEARFRLHSAPHPGPGDRAAT